MPQESGVQAAIRELEREDKRVREAIAMLKRIRPTATFAPRGRGRHLSAETRRKISQATKRRWAALREKKRTAKRKAPRAARRKVLKPKAAKSSAPVTAA